MTEKPRNSFCHRTRREFLWQAGGGFTALPLLSMLSGDGFLAQQATAADVSTLADSVRSSRGWLPLRYSPHGGPSFTYTDPGGGAKDVPVARAFLVHLCPHRRMRCLAPT